MKTIVLKESLRDALAVVERNAAKSLSLPVLSNVMLSVEKNRIRLLATDLQIGVTYQCLATTEEEGKTVFLAKPLSFLLGAFEEDQVQLEAKEQNLAIRCGTYRAAIKTLDPEEFPIIPSLKGDEAFVEVETAVLCRAMSQVVGMAGQSQARPEISGVFFAFTKEAARIAATDSFRLAEKIIDFEKPQMSQQSFILPQKTVREAIAILGERPGKTKIYFSPNQVVFDYAPEGQAAQLRIQIVSRLIEGEYPHYQEIIPSGHKTKVRLPKGGFSNHLKAASIFSGKTSEVRLLVDPAKNGVEFLSQSSEAGQNQSFLAGEVTGEKAEVAFNWKFLSDGISQMRGEEIDLEMNGGDGPALLRPAEPERYLYVVMPVKA